ncbi:HAD family hydrolase [Cellulomonas endophytica]|uniref:HAD family hydrolase n=1 Tax=Cellulomonas endophytica TaxID=2494735 RepID=UPI00101140A5|nr:HAD family hydrolase [Cellulomonas endophytica]
MTGPDAPAGATGAPLAGRVEGVLLDVDDTLVDTRAAFGAAVDAVCARWMPHLDATGRAAALDLWRADPGGHYRAYTRGDVGFDEQRRRRAAELHARFGGPPVEDEAAYRDWLTVFWGAFEGAWRAHPDAGVLLDALGAAGVPVGALSNAGTQLQTAKLARAGLARVPLLVAVDTLAGPDGRAVGKPDPRVFLEACARLGTDPARTAYVGDEADVDALGAVAAGLVGVWLDRPGERRGGPHLEDPERVRRGGAHVVPSLAALVPLLGLPAGR